MAAGFHEICQLTEVSYLTEISCLTKASYLTGNYIEIYEDVK